MRPAGQDCCGEDHQVWGACTEASSWKMRRSPYWTVGFDVACGAVDAPAQQPGSGGRVRRTSPVFALVLTAINLTVSPLRIRILMRSVGFFLKRWLAFPRSPPGRATNIVLGEVLFPGSRERREPNTRVPFGLLSAPRITAGVVPIKADRNAGVAGAWWPARPYGTTASHIRLLTCRMLGMASLTAATIIIT